MRQYKIYNENYEVEPDYEDRPNRATRRETDKFHHPHRVVQAHRFRTLDGRTKGTPTVVALFFRPTKVDGNVKKLAARAKRKRQHESRRINHV
jgi:hypothetical protein